jgi:pimeloyl-ACP methyl ester carboxylesterase
MMKFSRILLMSTLFLIGCSSSFKYKFTSGEKSHCVVLLHGLRSSSFIWGKLEKELLANGYRVLKVDYPSFKYDIQTLSEKSIGDALHKCHTFGVDTISFVGHSMGNILLRQYLKKQNIPELYRWVMISPPNQGNEMVDKFEKFKLFRKINGPAGMQLGAKEDGFIKTLPVPNCEFGIIAGNKSINWIVSAFLPGKDDGRVSIENTKLPGMKDFIVVKSNHHFMTKNNKVVKLVVNFMNNGLFDINTH